MQNVIFISEELQSIIDKKAEAIGITTSAYISDFLENSFKNELNGVSQKSYVELYSELRQAVIDYKNTLEHGKKFTLRDVPYYAELSVTTVNGTHSISSKQELDWGGVLMKIYVCKKQKILKMLGEQ